MTKSVPSPRWHRSRWANIVLRFIGLLLIVVAWKAGIPLFLDARAHHLTTTDDAFAMTTFLAGSAGTAALMLGAQLFEQVTIATRWGHIKTDRRTRPRQEDASINR